MADIILAGKTEMEVTHRDQVKIELARGQKGTYGWTLTVYGPDTGTAMMRLVATDRDLYQRFGADVNGQNNGSDDKPTTE